MVGYPWRGRWLAVGLSITLEVLSLALRDPARGQSLTLRIDNALDVVGQPAQHAGEGGDLLKQD